MEIDAVAARQVLDAALADAPGFAEFGPRIEYQPLFKGGAFVVRFDTPPAKDTPGLWDFQNAAVKGYKKLKGV